MPAPAPRRSEPRGPVGRWAAVLVVALGIGLGLGPATTGTAAVAPRVAADVGPSLRWRPCGALQCAALAVPVDHAVPDGPTVDLALVRAPARTPSARIGSLVVDPGGPGGSGVEYVQQTVWVMDPTVRDRFDVVGFDPRGTGASRPVDCRFDLARYFALDAAPRDAAGWDALVAASRDYGAACAAAEGDWLSQISTDDTVRDLDLIRRALGDERLTYLGYSYGTVIGARYAAVHPDRVRVLVLDGPVDPTLPSAESHLAQAVGFESVLGNFLRWCDVRRCSARRGAASTAVAYDALDGSVRRRGLAAGADRVLSHTEFMLGVATALYAGRAGFPILDRALAAAARGAGSRIAALSDAHTERSATGSYGRMQDAFFAISCADGPPVGTVADVRALFDRAAAAAPRLGPGIVSNALVCAQWPVPAGDPAPATVPPGLPILVVGTRQDPATPYPGAVALARQVGAALLSVAGDQHTSFGSGSRCVDTRVVRVLVSGARPARDLDCA